MKHDIHVQGFAFELRPIEREDAAFIAEVRTPERSSFLHPITRTVEAQQAFLDKYFERPGDYYFVIQRKDISKKEGLTGLLDFDMNKQSAQWGRLILRPGSFAAAETALMMLRLAFDKFLLNEVWGTVHLTNAPMIAYLKSLGFARRSGLQMAIGDTLCDADEYVLTASQWPDLETRLTEIARILAERALRTQ
jgi:RimJ/RimL family protein N-acetyltransferase